MLDGVDSDFELEVFEGGVLADGLEGGLEIVWCGVCRERFDYAPRRSLREIRAYGGEVLRLAGEESDCEIAVGGVGENSCYAGSLDEA